MKTIVFVGPTIPRSEAESLLSAVYLPPASRGSVYSAAQSRPWAIAIIDGFFHRVPSVLHKEILWAMSRGIHVYGSSSMGALRAAELSPFGMVGVGKVFEAYRDGTLTDDDEVAIAHGSSETGYIRGSEAMVNIRATLKHACECKVIDTDFHAAVLHIAKGIFYPERTYERLLQVGIERGLAPDKCERLSLWLPSARVDVKRDDAAELLLRIHADQTRFREPKQVSYRFHSTTIWEHHCNTFDGRHACEAAGSEESLGDELLDELRLRGDQYAVEREKALARVLASELAGHHGDTLDAVTTDEAVFAARRTHGLSDDRALEEWLTRNGLSLEGFTGLIQDEVLVRRMRARYRTWVPRSLYDSLRLTGKYTELEARARDKQVLLARWGLSSPALADSGMSEPELWQWFFTTVLGRRVPDDLDAFAASQDYVEVDTMRRAALRELLYRHKSAVTSEARSSPTPKE